MNTAEIARTWALMPDRARKRVVKSAALSAVLNGVGGAGLPYLVSMGGLHGWADLEGVFWVCLYGALFGLFIHFKQPGIRMQYPGMRRQGENGKA